MLQLLEPGFLRLVSLSRRYLALRGIPMNTAPDQPALSVEEIIRKYQGSYGDMLAMLAEIQAKYLYLPPDALRQVAAATGRSLTEIYGVATFYKAFSLKPRGKNLVSVCLGTACHVRGAPRVLEEFSRQLDLKPGETSADKEFTLETVNCLGACALGPTVVVAGRYFRHVSTAQVPQILEKARQGFQNVDPAQDERIFPLSLRCPHCRQTLMDPSHLIQGWPSLRVAVSFAGQKNTCWLSGLYGAGERHEAKPIPEGSLPDFFCPYCAKELAGGDDCPECGAPMARLSANPCATLGVCTRQGCPGHRLDLTAGGQPAPTAAPSD